MIPPSLSVPARTAGVSPSARSPHASDRPLGQKSPLPRSLPPSGRFLSQSRRKYFGRRPGLATLGILLSAAARGATHDALDTWERFQLPGKPDLQHVAFGQDRWVAVQAPDTLLSSTNGREWRTIREGRGTPRLLPNGFADWRIPHFSAAAFGAGQWQFVLTQEDRFLGAHSFVYRSSPASDWTDWPLTTTWLHFYVVDIGYDGRTWRALTLRG